MKRTGRMVLVLASVSLLLPGMAAAELVNVYYMGTVTYNQSHTALSNVGDPFFGSFSFNTSSRDQDLTQVSPTYVGHPVSYSNNPFLDYYFAVNTPGAFRMGYLVNQVTGDVSIGFEPQSLRIDQLIVGEAPTGWLTAADGSFDQEDGAAGYIGGTISQFLVSRTVPEPSTLLIAGLAMACIGLGMARRKGRHLLRYARKGRPG